nr:unnamed protein product [Spirometra erinaceieuropaei]
MAFPPNSPNNHQPPSKTSAATSWINKLKIVGSGQNWSVAPPFYLMSAEPPAPDATLTGAKNLIEHYGLESAYQKFCGRKLRDELSAFLPHLSGNVNMPASEDGSGLLGLVERPPITGKELMPFAPNQLDHGFRLHPGPLPQEYMSLFMAPPANLSTVSATGTAPGDSAGPTGSSIGNATFPTKPNPGGSVSSQPLQAPTSRGSSTPGGNMRKRRREIHRGGAPLPQSGGTPASFGGAAQPSSAAVVSAHPHWGAGGPSRSLGAAVSLGGVGAAAPHSGPPPSMLMRSSEPMPSLQPSSCLPPPPPPPLLTSVQHLVASKPASSSSLSSSAQAPHPPPVFAAHHHHNPATLPTATLGPPSLKKVLRPDEQSIMTGGGGSSNFFDAGRLSTPSSGGGGGGGGDYANSGLDPEEERRRKKRKEKRYKKERE